MSQKQKTAIPGMEPEDTTFGNDDGARDAAAKGKSVSERIDNLLKTKTNTPTPQKKKGHYENCCGMRRWVAD